MTREEREYEKALKAYLLECEKKFRAEHGKEVNGFGSDLSLELYKKYADEYINGEPWESPQTKQKNKFGVSKFIDFMEAEGFTEINPTSLLAYRRSLVECSPNTVSQYMKRVRASLNWMVNMRLIKENPVPKSMISQERYTTAKPILNKGELMEVLNAHRPERFRKSQFVRNRAMVILLLTSGMRESEMLALTPADLHWDEDSITIKSGKGRKTRTVSFMGIAKQAVKEYMARERPDSAGEFDPLFLTVDGDKFSAISKSSFYRAVKSYLIQATGRDDLSPHSLRHTYATYLTSDGMNATELQALLGHSSLSTTQRYAQLLAPDVAPIQHAESTFDEILFTAAARKKAEERALKSKTGPKPKRPMQENLFVSAYPPPEPEKKVDMRGRYTKPRSFHARPKDRFYATKSPSTQ